MADKIVYVHPTAESTEGVEVITPKALDGFLAEGWEIVSTKGTKVGEVKVDRVHLRRAGANGIVHAPEKPKRPKRDLARRDGGFLGTVSPAAGGPGALSVPVGNRSFLGGGSDFAGLPGLETAGSLVVQHAYAMGVDAAHTGGSEADCPWPSGLGASQWRKGFREGLASQGGGAGQGTAGRDTGDAYANGMQAAKGPEDAEVSCPYPSNTPHYRAWLRGFRDGGGRVEG